MTKSLQDLQGLLFCLVFSTTGATISPVNLPTDHRMQLCHALLHYQHTHPQRAAIAQRILHFVQHTPDCFSRSHTAGHITASA